MTKLTTTLVFLRHPTCKPKKALDVTFQRHVTITSLWLVAWAKLNVRYAVYYISLPSSAKKRLQVNTFAVFTTKRVHKRESFTLHINFTSLSIRSLPQMQTQAQDSKWANVSFEVTISLTLWCRLWRLSQGFRGTSEHWQNIEDNKSLFLGNRGTKLSKLEDENIVSKSIKRGKNKEIV
mgnify:CR=1 FL=1